MDSHIHIIFAPMLPEAALLSMGLGALVLCVYAAYRRAKGAILRAALFGLLLLVLANPSVIREQREPLKDTALVVIDDSASMKLGERLQQTARAADVVTNKLKAFSDLDMETLHVTGDEETDLFQAVTAKLQTLPSRRLAGVIALTDGQIHDTPSQGLTAPFHALIAGHHDEIDRRLVIKAAPNYGLVGKSVTLTLRIDDQPKTQSENATVTFRRDDGSSQSIAMPVGKDVPFDVPIDHAGHNLFAFTVESLPDEITTVNNSATVSVNGIRDRLRVLLVSGAPHIGGRTWRNYLKADPAVDLVHFTILRTPEKSTFAPNKDMALIVFPTHELFAEKLKTFDLVIFDRFSNRSLIPDEYLQNIAHYVEQGGALLLSSATDESVLGLNDSPLERILPAMPSGKLLTGSFVPDLTETGKRHPVTGALTNDRPRSEWSPWFRQIDATAPRGEVLMTGKDNAPLLILDHVGQGRVAEFLSDQFWLWARGYEKGGPQAELLRRVAHWLVQEPELDESALRASAALVKGEWQLTISKRSLHDDQAQVTVIDPDDKTQQATLSPSAEAGLLTVTLPVPKLGLYRIKEGDRELLTIAGAMNAPEFGDMRATEDKIAAAVKASGGGISWLADHPDALAIKRTDADAAQSGWNWIGLKRNGQYRVMGSEAIPLWPAWFALALLLAVMMGGWRREGKT